MWSIAIALLALLGGRPVAQTELPETMTRIVKATALKSKFSKCLEAQAAAPPAPSGRAPCAELAAQAVAEYSAALESGELGAETKAKILVGLGDLHREQGNLANALASYDSALALAPGNVQALVGKARASEGLGRWAEAVEGYRNYLARKPGESEARLRLARLLATAPDPTTRNPAEAAKLAKEVSDLRGGNDPEALAVQAEALFAIGDTAGAIETAERAIFLAPDPGPYRRMLDRFEKEALGRVIAPPPSGEPVQGAREPAPATGFPENKGSLE